MSSKATDVFRNWKVNGVPSSGENEPSKSEIRAWGTWLESISVAGLGDAVWKSTQALLYADLAHAADIVAIVYADTTAANNGIYVKVGASGAGSWTQVTKFLPGYQFINGEDDGTSTANSYHIDASPIAPADDGSALVSFVVPVTNTNASVSVSFNGGAPFTIKTASGSAPVVGGLVQNMPVLGICIGSNFYMRSDQPTAAIQAATEAARNAAQAAQAAAEAAAASVSLPLITGKAGQVLAVKTDGSGLEYIPLNIAFVESRAYAIGSYHPVAAPTFLKVCGYSAVGDCPDALYVKVASAPAHAGKFSITTLSGATVWYELSRNQDIYAEFFGAIANQTDADALADDGTATTAAIIAGRTFLRGRSTNLTTDGLTGAPVTAYMSGVLNLGRGIFCIKPDMINTTADVGFIIRGRGNSGRNNYMRAPTTLLIRGASAGYGIRWYGNGGRYGALEDLEMSYDSSSFTGDQVDNFGAVGFCTRRVSFDSFGKTGATVLYTARSNISLAYEEFFYPKECTFNGADISIFSNTNKVVARFTASISGTTMTVTSIAEGALEVGQIIFDTVGIAAGTTITGYGTGTGGTGTYTVSISQTLSSRDMKTHISFGGSCTEIDNTNIFYDCGTKYVSHDGQKPRYGFYFSGVINPIRKGHSISIDLRNVHGMKVNDILFHGSVGLGPSSMFVYLNNCTGEVKNNFFGPGPLATTFDLSQLEVSGNRVTCDQGFLGNGGVLVSKANRFSCIGGSGWILPQTSGALIDFGPDLFDSGMSASYNLQGSAGTNTTRGRIFRSSTKDASSGGVVNASSNVTVTSV